MGVSLGKLGGALERGLVGVVIRGIHRGRGVPSSVVGWETVNVAIQLRRRLTSSPLTLHCLRAETLQFRQNPSLISLFSVTLHRIYSCCYTLNKLDPLTNGNYAIYRNP